LRWRETWAAESSGIRRRMCRLRMPLMVCSPRRMTSKSRWSASAKKLKPL